MSQLSRRLGVVLVVAAASVLPATAAGASGGRSGSVTVKVVSSKKYGTILETSSGRTLYLLTADKAKKLACNGGCLAIWPPLTTKGKPHAGSGVRSKLLGTVKRGGERQVTYDGHPLYFYAGDTGSGQDNGEGIVSFGGTWYVVGKAGKAVTATLASSSGGAPANGSNGGGSYGSSGSGGGGW
jgi:predicted lipoprotein with Yx(FWY)xxD motif